MFKLKNIMINVNSKVYSNLKLRLIDWFEFILIIEFTVTFLSHFTYLSISGETNVFCSFSREFDDEWVRSFSVSVFFGNGIISSLGADGIACSFSLLIFTSLVCFVGYLWYHFLTSQLISTTSFGSSFTISAIIFSPLLIYLIYFNIIFPLINMFNTGKPIFKKPIINSIIKFNGFFFYFNFWSKNPRYIFQ